MKCLTIIVHAAVKQDLADLLSALEPVSGFTFSDAEGHSDHSNSGHLLSVRDQVVGYIPRVRVEILLEEENVDPVISELQQHTWLKGNGRYWLTSLEQQGRF